MVQGKQVFTFIEKVTGVNSDGEKYFAINVLTKDTKKKLSFVTKDNILIDKLLSVKFIDYQDVILVLEFNRIYNAEKKVSYWNCELVGVANNGNNSSN